MIVSWEYLFISGAAAGLALAKYNLLRLGRGAAKAVYAQHGTYSLTSGPSVQCGGTRFHISWYSVKLVDALEELKSGVSYSAPLSCTLNSGHV